MTLRQRLDSPVVPMLVVIPLATAFVTLRWMHAAGHQLGRFVVAGSKYANQARVPKGLPVGVGSGYDGQFYYRLALNPFNLARTSYGIRFDSMSRVERMGYPFLAWALSLGHHSSVPLTLVIVNVLAAGVLGLAGGLLARSAGRHAAWGLVFPLYWGYLWTLGRDLSELTTAALVMMGLVALVRSKPLLAGVAFLGAVVTKETALLLIGTLALTTLWIRLRPRARVTLGVNAPPPTPSGLTARLALRRSDVAYLIPLAGFAVWQLVLLGDTGKLPIFESGGQNLGFPADGLVHGIMHYFDAFPSVASTIWFAEFAIMVVLVTSVARLRRHAPVEFQVLWFVSVVLGLCAAPGIWLGDVGFRSLDDIYLFSWVVVLYERRSLLPWGLLCAGAWVVVAAELIRYI